jgi:hypothetical protein
LLPNEMSNLMGNYAAAYFNLGVSFEHLKQIKLGTQAFERALVITKMHMPSNKAMISSLEQAIDSLRKKT